jgi:hypothetical protein|tara:strand:+ start:7384 stop:7542 length:159 start_codon:yes stop_codon:yes gene_type:complete
MRTGLVTLLSLLGLMVAIEAAHLKYHQETNDLRHGMGAGLDSSASDCSAELD